MLRIIAKVEDVYVCLDKSGGYPDVSIKLYRWGKLARTMHVGRKCRNVFFLGDSRFFREEIEINDEKDVLFIKVSPEGFLLTKSIERSEEARYYILYSENIKGTYYFGSYLGWYGVSPRSKKKFAEYLPDKFPDEARRLLTAKDLYHKDIVLTNDESGYGDHVGIEHINAGITQGEIRYGDYVFVYITENYVVIIDLVCYDNDSMTVYLFGDDSSKRKRFNSRACAVDGVWEVDGNIYISLACCDPDAGYKLIDFEKKLVAIFNKPIYLNQGVVSTFIGESPVDFLMISEGLVRKSTFHLFILKRLISKLDIYVPNEIIATIASHFD